MKFTINWPAISMAHASPSFSSLQLKFLSLLPSRISLSIKPASNSYSPSVAPQQSLYLHWQIVIFYRLCTFYKSSFFVDWISTLFFEICSWNFQIFFHILFCHYNCKIRYKLWVARCLEFEIGDSKSKIWMIDKFGSFVCSAKINWNNRWSKTRIRFLFQDFSFLSPLYF